MQLLHNTVYDSSLLIGDRPSFLIDILVGLYIFAYPSNPCNAWRLSHAKSQMLTRRSAASLAHWKLLRKFLVDFSSHTGTWIAREAVVELYREDGDQKLKPSLGPDKLRASCALVSLNRQGTYQAFLRPGVPEELT